MGKTKIKRVYIQNNRYFFMQDLIDRNPVTGRPKQKKHNLTKVDEGDVALHKALAELLETLNKGKYAGSIVRLIDEWQLNSEFGLLRYGESTRKEYHRMSEKIKEEFFDFEADQILPSDIAGFIDDNFQGKANAANKYKDVASNLFAFGMRKGYCTSNPCQGLQNHKESKCRDRYITDEELAAVRSGLLIGDNGKPNPSGEMMVCLVDLAVVTGQRTKDLLTLQWDQVMKGEGVLFFPWKTRNSSGIKVAVAMTPQLKAILDRARGIIYYQDDAKKVTYPKGQNVIHQINGSPYDRSGTYTAWTRAVKRARKRYEAECNKNGTAISDTFLKNMTFHDIKHKALTDADRQGLDTQKLGGHTDKKTTEKYIEEVEIEWIRPPHIKGI